MVKLPFEVLLLSALATSPLTLVSAQPIVENANSIKDVPQMLAPSDQQRLALDTKQRQQQQQEQAPPPPSDHSSSSSYRCYNGDPSAYPPPGYWLPFPVLWDLNRETILSANRGDVYLQHYIHTSLETLSTEYNTNPSFLLALLLQESHGGDVATPCTGPEPRCGLLHAYKGSLFDPSNPQSSITTMLRDGIQGAARRGPGLHDLLSGKPKFANVAVGEYFAVARAWNSGEVRAGDLDWTKGKGEAGFVNDVANRLMGWDGRGMGFAQCRVDTRTAKESDDMEWYYPSFLADL